MRKIIGLLLWFSGAATLGFAISLQSYLFAFACVGIMLLAIFVGDSKGYWL